MIQTTLGTEWCGGRGVAGLLLVAASTFDFRPVTCHMNNMMSWPPEFRFDIQNLSI